MSASCSSGRSVSTLTTDICCTVIMLGEGAEAGHGHDLLAVGRADPRHEHHVVGVLAEVRLVVQAVPAHAARGDERADHAVADREAGDVARRPSRPRRCPRGRAPRGPAGSVPLITREVGVAHAAGGDADDHVSRDRGRCGVTSSTESGWSCSRHRAAFMVFPLASGCGVCRSYRAPTARATFPRMARILLVRHGQSEWNADGRWQGQADPPLSELGSGASGRRGRARSAMVDAIYASDLVRAHHTAELVAAQLGADVVVEPACGSGSAGELGGPHPRRDRRGVARLPRDRASTRRVRARRLGARARARRPRRDRGGARRRRARGHARRGRACASSATSAATPTGSSRTWAASGWSTTTGAAARASASSSSTNPGHEAASSSDFPVATERRSGSPGADSVTRAAADPGRKLTSSPNPEHRLLSDPLATGPAAMADGPDADHDPEHPRLRAGGGAAPPRHRLRPPRRHAAGGRAGRGGVHRGHPGRHPPGAARARGGRGLHPPAARRLDIGDTPALLRPPRPADPPSRATREPGDPAAAVLHRPDLGHRRRPHAARRRLAGARSPSPSTGRPRSSRWASPAAATSRPTAGELVGLDDEVFDADAAEASGSPWWGRARCSPRSTRSAPGGCATSSPRSRPSRTKRSGADLAGILVVAGGPGTGKTAVALHRAAYLLYTHRQRLASQGVLLVGPSPIFLRYIDEVLPSLGEDEVQLATPAGAEAAAAGRAATEPEPSPRSRATSAWRR